MLACLVDRGGNALYPWPHLENSCCRYEFNLESRKPVFIPCGKPPFLVERLHDMAARTYFDDRVGTPEKLMAFSRMDYLDKSELVSLLRGEKRQDYLKACGVMEKELTQKCGDKGEPCLADGCSFKETGEACLNAILSSEEEYRTRCAIIWEELFMSSGNRIDVWKS